MNNIKKMKKRAKKKDKKIKLSKFEKKGIISRKKRMKNEILIVFVLVTLLSRQNCHYSV